MTAIPAPSIRASPTAARILNSTPAPSRSARPGSTAAHACAVLDDHSVWCWGNNNFGSLGDGTTTNRLSPVPVVGLNTAVNVSCSFGTTCATLSSGSVSCWGLNEHGDLGIGSELPGQS